MLETDVRKTFEHNWNFDKDQTTFSEKKLKNSGNSSEFTNFSCLCSFVIDRYGTFFYSCFISKAAK